MKLPLFLIKATKDLLWRAVWFCLCLELCCLINIKHTVNVAHCHFKSHTDPIYCYTCIFTLICLHSFIHNRRGFTWIIIKCHILACIWAFRRIRSRDLHVKIGFYGGVKVHCWKGGRMGCNNRFISITVYQYSNNRWRPKSKSKLNFD